MGILFSSLFETLFGKKEIRVLILGLDNAGKTTLLHKIVHPNKCVKTMPTIGFNVETVAIPGGITMNVWDLGGQSSIRPYWRLYYHNTQAIIFVVDSTDKQRFGQVKQELFALLEEEELKDTIILIFNNKRDLEETITMKDDSNNEHKENRSADEKEVCEALGLTSIRDRQWQIFRTSAYKGEGVQEGLEWLSNAINTQK